MKDLKVTESFREIKFEGIWTELLAKNYFQKQSFTKYLKLTLVFMRNSALQGILISVFQWFFASINKILI